LRNALEVTEKVGREYGEKFGRSYKSYEWYGDRNAKLVVILLGESAGAARTAVAHLQGREGVSGLALMRIRLFNPFPAEVVAKALYRAGTEAVVVLDEGLAHGDVFPPLALRVASALHAHLGSGAPRLASVIGGLGGSEIRPNHFQTLFNLAENIAQGRPYRREPYWLDIEEDPVLLTDQSNVKPRLWKRYGDVWKAQPILPQYHTPFPTTNYEIRLYGRAGQGAITSAVFFTGAGIEKGLWVLTKPTFGSERRGAVVHCDTLIQTNGTERTRSFSGWQDLVCIYDDTILNSTNHASVQSLEPGGTLLVNSTRYTPNRIRELLQLPAETAVFVVPASRIAHELQLGSFFNMVMLGAMHRVCPLVDFDAAAEFYKANVPSPKEKNLEAIRRGYAETTDREIVTEEAPVVNALAEELFQWRPEEESFELAMLRSLENPRGS
jgi:2-oxoacid:acceptor oxidoreductase gamma subunit (pyruvate/2-ketoisovalerate family)